MLKKILIVLLAAIAAFAGYVAIQPDDFSVTRSATISASPADVFAQVNDLHNWEAWSPWAKLDPAAKNTFEGPAAGVGANFKWSGNSEVGEGGMTITESKPSELVRIKLEFVRPFAGTNDVDFTFKPDGDKTVVTWNMVGKQGFVHKAVCLIVNGKKMCGDQFDAGLAAMKAVAEKGQK